LAEAKATLVQLLKINPNYARGWCDLSQIKSDLKDFDGAMIDAKHAVELDPDDAVVNSWLAELGTKDSKVK